MSILEWLYDSAAADLIRASLWGYPITLTIHGIGMGIVVGLLLVVNLRLLGYFRNISIQGLPKLWGWAVFGFIINLISGLLLFVADAPNFATNWAFLLKILMIVIGVVIAFLLKTAPVFKNIQNLNAEAVAGTKGRILAVTSLLVWLLAIIFGRLVGYVL